MKTRRRPVLVAIPLLLVAAIAAAQGDIPGSRDHPLISRMPQYHISSYEVSEFAAFDPTVIDGPEVRWEGKKYSISYAAPDEGAPVSTLQIVRNYEAAIGRAGGKKLGGDERRLAAEIRKGPAVTGVYVEAFNEGRLYQLTIVEMGPMRQDVVADASAMGKDLAASGRTIVHGLHFDTGSTTIRPESEAALGEMVKLLKSAPKLNVYIVGHTDNAGSLETNMKLSADRAESVVKALVAKGIAASRLRPFGAGPHAPVASNREENGRAQNRRVELVER